jgi:hypothetical protein
MNPKDANPAATLAKTTEDLSVKCSTLYVLNAENLARFLSSPEMTVLYIAANAFQSREINCKCPLKYASRGVLFLCLSG